MKILSIDVGIRNLSFCLFTMENADKNTLSVLKWDNIDLTEKMNNRCIFVSEKENEGLCDKPAKFVKEGKCYCLKHSKKLNFSDLRAIPFVGSWSQLKQNVPGYYGVGTALQVLKEKGLYDSVWQAGAIFLPVQSVGVMGDERTYENAVALRAVSSTDGMTADWVHLPYEFLAEVSNTIINRVKGVNRVVYDISSKPPATIEWE